MLGLALRPCTAEDQAKCREEHPDPAHLAWACEHCKRTKPEDVSPYTLHILQLVRLREAGFPFKADDLDLQTWQDMGLVREALKEAKEHRRWELLVKLFTCGSR